MTKPAGSDQGARYPASSVLLHWSVALLVLLASGLALFREAVGAEPGAMISAHKRVGLAILALALFRLAWRGREPYVAPVGGRPARAVHGLLLGLTAFVPIAGWLFVSLAPATRPIEYRGHDNIPRLPLAPNDAASFAWHEVHEILGFVLVALMLVHLAGVARAEWTQRGRVLSRMLPRSRWARVLILAALALWFVGLALDLAGVRPREIPASSGAETPAADAA